MADEGEPLFPDAQQAVDFSNRSAVCLQSYKKRSI